MQIRRPSADGKVLYGVVFAETVGDDSIVALVLTHLDFFLVMPDVEADVGFLKTFDFKIIDEHIRQDGPEQFL